MKKILTGVFVAALTILPAGAAFAATQGELSQTINTGTLTTDIVNIGGTTVASPSFAMSATTIDTVCQTVTGTYGSNTQRVAVDNPGGADNGWTLTIAATTGPTATWTSGGNSYSFNNPAAAGCTGGQLTLNPSVATSTLVGISTSTGISKGSQASYSSGAVDSITLMTAAAGSDNIWSGYLTGIGVSQTIPGQTPAGTYTIDLTQTVTAS